MKTILLALFLAGCAAEASNKADAGLSVHVENQWKYIYAKYYPVCFRRNWDTDKCNKDFSQIKKVYIRAIRDHQEDDFNEMMDTWYGGKD